jgi:hypothetical protein
MASRAGLPVDRRNAPHAKPIKTLICQLFASEEVV